jgi:hypothetical protein
MHDLPVLLENVPLEEQESIWFILDGGLPHHTNAVRQQLHYLFSDKFIDIGTGNNTQYSPDVTWPPRSSDFIIHATFSYGVL